MSLADWAEQISDVVVCGCVIAAVVVTGWRLLRRP